jgi:hypothetical protein
VEVWRCGGVEVWRCENERGYSLAVYQRRP